MSPDQLLDIGGKCGTIDGRWRDREVLRWQNWQDAYSFFFFSVTWQSLLFAFWQVYGGTHFDGRDGLTTERGAETYPSGVECRAMEPGGESGPPPCYD